MIAVGIFIWYKWVKHVIRSILIVSENDCRIGLEDQILRVAVFDRVYCISDVVSIIIQHTMRYCRANQK